MRVTLERVEDIGRLMEWRAEVILNVFGKEADAGLLEANRRYYERHINDGSHIALVARDGDEEAGCGAICITEELPSPDNPGGRCAYLMNIYVREPYRSRGIATTIVNRLVELARERQCGKIYLETTDMGRRTYLNAGFEDMKGMMKYATV